MTLIRLGRLRRPHGIHGEIGLDAISLTAAELHAVATFTWRGPKGAERELRLATARPATGHLIVRFHGIESREAAAALTNGELLAPRERLPDPGPETAYTFQLIGLEVRTEEGRSLGTLAEVLNPGGQPLYVVRGERELMIPAVPAVVKKVDLAAGVITVAPPPGLEEL
jgi:16S rRNA processing protein RimM